MNQQFTALKKLTLTSLMLIALSACGSSDKAVTTTQPGTQTVLKGTEQQVVPLNSAVIQVEMNHNEMETVFETRDVPSTCTRVVQRGTHPECHTESSQVCNTQIERECRNVSFPVCQNFPENVCRDVPDQVCHTTQVPVCHTNNEQVCHSEPHQSCETTQVCTTQNDQVCHGTPPNQQCTNIPRRVCNPVQSCHTSNQQVCHTESHQSCQNETRQQCDQITRRECRVENHQSCHNETRQECNNVPRQHCENVPRQACVEVPTIEQEQYSCMQPQQVPVGERLQLHTLARVTINVRNPRNIDISRDNLVITMNQGVLSAVVQSASGIQYQVRQSAPSVVRTGPTEEVVTTTFDVEVIF